MKTESVTLLVGESIDINPGGNYAFIIIVNSGTTSMNVGVFGGSVYNEIFKNTACKLSVSEGDTWGSFKITNNSDKKAFFNVHMFI